MEFKQKAVGVFGGFNMAATGAATMKVKLNYSDIVTSVQLLQTLNTDVTVQAKIPQEKAKNLGIFTIGSVNFDRDGNANITFKSLAENIESNNILDLVGEELIQFRFLAVLDLPEKEQTLIEQKGEQENG